MNKEMLSLFHNKTVKLLSHIWLFATPWIVTYQAPPSMGFSRQECWSGLPFPSPGDLPDPRIEPMSPALAGRFFTTEPPGKPHIGFSTVQFSLSVMSDSLQPHESQHTRPPCPSPTPGVHSDSCPLSRWCHPAISSSVVPFSSCPQSLPASRSFPMSELFAWVCQSTGVSALASFLPKKSQGYLLQDRLPGSPCSPRDSQESSPTPQFKSINSSVLSFLHSPTFTSIHDHRKNHSLD